MTAHDRNDDDATNVDSPRGRDTQQRCVITVHGHLSARWSTWFDGLDLVRNDDGTTDITGPIVDQSALHGLLQKLRDLGIPLISLMTTPIDDNDNDTERL